MKVVEDEHLRFFWEPGNSWILTGSLWLPIGSRIEIVRPRAPREQRVVCWLEVFVLRDHLHDEYDLEYPPRRFWDEIIAGSPPDGGRLFGVEEVC